MKQKPIKALLALMASVLLPITAVSLHDAINKEDVDLAIQQIFVTTNLDELQCGKSPLHLAAENALDDVVKILLKMGAKINRVSSEGETALDIALTTGNKALIKILIEQGGLYREHAFSPLRATVELEKLLKSADMRELFPFIYPLFATDLFLYKALRSLLRQNLCPAWSIEEVLHSLADDDFPNGSLEPDALNELGALLDEIKASHILRAKIDCSLDRYFLERTQIIPFLAWMKKEEVPRNKVINLAQALTVQESKLIKAIELSHLANWIFEPGSVAEIEEYFNYLDRCSALFASFISFVGSKKERYLEVKKLLLLGQNFLEINNLSGVNRVVNVLIEQLALYKIKLKKTEHEKFKKLQSVVSQKNNYKNYNKHLSKLSRTQPYIPILEIMLSDLRRNYDLSPQLLHEDIVVKLAVTLRQINNIKRADDYFFGSEKALNALLKTFTVDLLKSDDLTNSDSTANDDLSS